VTCGSEKIAMPRAMQTIGSDKGSRLRASGSHATSAMRNPAPIKIRM
jgi:hypothetical protein